MKSWYTIIMNTVSLFTWRSKALSHLFLRRCNWRVVTLSILRLSQQRWCRVHPVLFTSKNTSRLASRNRGQPAVFIYVQKKHTITSLPPADGNRRCERPRSRKLGHVERKRSPFSRFVEKQTRRRFWQGGEYPASARLRGRIIPQPVVRSRKINDWCLCGEWPLHCAWVLHPYLFSNGYQKMCAAFNFWGNGRACQSGAQQGGRIYGKHSLSNQADTI